MQNEYKADNCLVALFITLNTKSYVCFRHKLLASEQRLLITTSIHFNKSNNNNSELSTLS